MELKNLLGNTDIYLIDQILKNRYTKGESILDAGCGNGRNLFWFYQNDFSISGVDQKAERIENIKNNYKKAKAFYLESIDRMHFTDASFDHVICSAVLHFAVDEKHFFKMLAELMRVLKAEGTLFIRMASDFGMTKPFRHIKHGVYELHDGSQRFLLNESILNRINSNYEIEWLEPLKTTNVDNLRCMSTLVLRKL